MSKLAINGGTPAVVTPHPSWPVVDNTDVERMKNVVSSGKWSWVGPNEQEFCEGYRRFIGTRYCMALSNGTVTLQCALQAAGVEPGDDVIVPALTWVATAQAAMDIGANVIFADIDPVTLNLDPNAFKAAVTPTTRAVIPVHLYGCMCDMDAILETSAKHGIRVIEDVAHQHGSMWRDKCAGAIGDAGSFSFQQSKVLTSGEGGAITCNDTEIYSIAFALKQVGWTPSDPENTPYSDLVMGNRYGHNYRMTEMQAALLIGGLSRLEDQIAVRERNAKVLADSLEKAGGPLQVVRPDSRVTRQSYYALTLCFDPTKSEGVHRNAYLKALQAEKCPFGTTYGPVYRNPLLNLYDKTSPIPYRDAAKVQDYRSLALPNTEQACNNTAVTLPQTALLGDETYIRQLAEAVDKVNSNLKNIPTEPKKEGDTK